jgi:hypothetical protein
MPTASSLISLQHDLEKLVGSKGDASGLEFGHKVVSKQPQNSNLMIPTTLVKSQGRECPKAKIG